MDLGFAVAAEADGDWGDEELTEVAAGALPVFESAAQLPQVPDASPPRTPASARDDGASQLGPPKSKIHSNPRTRYFVIKSSNHRNLVLSVENNVWATQRHNEERFNEALQSAPHVILVFSVNCSGCFQGYAKMTGTVGSSQKTHVFPGYGRAFDVRWLRLDDLDFSEVSNVLNPWNENKSVKISRDGQELPNDVGRQVCELFDRRVYQSDPGAYVTDENEVETGGFVPPLALMPPDRPPQVLALMDSGAAPPGGAEVLRQHPPGPGSFGSVAASAAPGGHPPSLPWAAGPPWGPWAFPPPWGYPWGAGYSSSSHSSSYSGSDYDSASDAEPEAAQRTSRRGAPLANPPVVAGAGLLSEFPNGKTHGLEEENGTKTKEKAEKACRKVKRRRTEVEKDVEQGVQQRRREGSGRKEERRHHSAARRQRRDSRERTRRRPPQHGSHRRSRRGGSPEDRREGHSLPPGVPAPRPRAPWDYHPPGPGSLRPELHSHHAAAPPHHWHGQRPPSWGSPGYGHPLPPHGHGLAPYQGVPPPRPGAGQWHGGAHLSRPLLPPMDWRGACPSRS